MAHALLKNGFEQRRVAPHATTRDTTMFAFQRIPYSGPRGRATAARQRNQLEVGGSIPSPATISLTMEVPGSDINSRSITYAQRHRRLLPRRTRGLLRVSLSG